MIAEFAAGVRTLFRGVGAWQTHPRLMLLGLVPGLIAAALIVAALVPLVFSLGTIAEAATPFAGGWAEPWLTVFRGAVALMLFAAALALASAVFTGLALAVGEPIYQRIWRATETDLGDPPADTSRRWVALREGIRLVLVGLLTAIVVLAVGFIPLVGWIVAPVLGVMLSGRLVARELTGRAFDARGFDSPARDSLLRRGRARVLGFGVATQVCFMVPFGAIVMMPSAVAGSTLLARTLLEPAAATNVSQRPETPSQ